jgi:hypothetical protein
MWGSGGHSLDFSTPSSALQTTDISWAPNVEKYCAPPFQIGDLSASVSKPLRSSNSFSPI